MTTEAVADFVVCEALSTRVVLGADLGVVLTIGLSVSYCYRAIDVMLRSELIEEPCLRIEEVEGLLEVDLLRYHGSLAILHEVVDSTCDAVVDEAVLEVGKEVEASHYLIVRLDEA